MDTSLVIKESALDILSWLVVDEGSARVERTTSLNEPEQSYRVSINCSDASLLIGKNGDTLAAFQHLLRVIVAKRADADAGKYHLTVDVDGYRERKAEQAVEAALRRAERVATTGAVERLLPMDAYLRRAVHLAVAAKFPTLTTESLGNGRLKVVVIKRA